MREEEGGLNIWEKVREVGVKEMKEDREIDGGKIVNY